MIEMINNILIGKWIERDGQVIEDEICKKINWPINNQLQLISIDESKYTAIYKNIKDQTFWQLSHPQSNLHRGGPPKLESITRSGSNE